MIICKWLHTVISNSMTLLYNLAFDCDKSQSMFGTGFTLRPMAALARSASMTQFVSNTFQSNFLFGSQSLQSVRFLNRNARRPKRANHGKRPVSHARRWEKRGFLTKTFEIFSSPEYSECCGWGPNGDTIVIKKIEQFSKEVVPKFFKHSNFQSFVRQLNMYDFHKTVQDPSHGEFAHEFFKRGKPELLVHIKRKANKAPIASTAKSKTSKGGSSSNSSSRTGQNTAVGPVGGVSTNVIGTAGTMPLALNSSLVGYGVPGQSMAPALLSGQSALPSGVSTTPDILFTDQSADLDESLVGGYYVDEEGGLGGSGSAGGYYGDAYSSSHHNLLPEEIASETGHVLSELNQQRSQRESFERRMEQKLASLQGENNMLKRMFMESHHKNAVMQERMERVMKTLYSMFMGGGGNVPGMALTNRAPSMLLTDMQHFQQQQGGAADGSGGGYSSSALTVGNPLTRFTSRDGTLSRLDSASLERLPSLDLAELNSLAAVSAEPIPPSANSTNHSSNNSSNNSNNYAQFLLRRQNAGAALEADSRGNSFDLAASAVTAPSFQRQSTFDGAYLPIPPEKGADHPAVVSTYSTSSSGPAGRVYLQPASTGIAHLGPAEQAGADRALAGAPLSAARKPPLHSPVSSTSAGALPLMRQRTFDPVSNGSGADKDDQHKRKAEELAAEEGPDAKKAKAAEDNEDELRRLESEDVQSSMHEAAEFMDLLNRNQQTTLTRLDSLEQTIASLFDSAGNEESEGGGHATLGGDHSAGERDAGVGEKSAVKNQK